MRFLVIPLILSTLITVIHGGGKTVPKGKPGSSGNSTKDADEDQKVAADISSNISTTVTPTVGFPTLPPETKPASKMSERNWIKLTGEREIYVSDPDFFRDMVQPMADHAIFLSGAGVMAGNMVERNVIQRNSTNTTSNADSDSNATGDESVDDSVHPGNTKRDLNGNQIGPTTKVHSGNFGIYFGIVVAICVIGLFSIFCVARANGQRVRDYEIGNRRGPRRSGAGLAAASGWRRSQDYLNDESTARGYEDRSAMAGSQLNLNPQSMAGSQLNLHPQVIAGSQMNLYSQGMAGSQLSLNPQAIPMNRMESDVTDV